MGDVATGDETPTPTLPTLPPAAVGGGSQLRRHPAFFAAIQSSIFFSSTAIGSAPVISTCS